MVNLIMIADLKDGSDPEGRTFREVNNATHHKFNLGDLVQLESGVRLFVARKTRDCDGTPMYSLAEDALSNAYLNGFSEDGMALVEA